MKTEEQIKERLEQWRELKIKTKGGNSDITMAIACFEWVLQD